MTTEDSPGIRRSIRIDRDAFAANLAVALSRDPGGFLDARADAYGHGIRFLAPAAVAAGVAGIRVSDEWDAHLAESAGFATHTIATGPVLVLEPPLLAASVYGVDPTDGSLPVMRVSGEVLAVKRVGAGAGVSYGYSYRTTVATTLALVGLGYADGIPRPASNRAHVALGGRLVPIAGRIAMDQFVVDCGEAAPEPGDEVVLFGDPDAGAPSAADWGIAADREPLAVTAGLGSRFHTTATGGAA